MLGGIIDPSAPPAQIMPMESFRSYRRRKSCGRATIPSSVTSPPMTPIVAPIRTAISMVATPTPPATPPAQMCTALNRSWATPERSRIDAIRMNIGTEARTNSVMKLYVRLGISVSAAGPKRVQANRQRLSRCPAAGRLTASSGRAASGAGARSRGRARTG